MLLSENLRRFLLIFAVIGGLVPNGLYLYFAFTRPDLNAAAMANPVAQAFMIEAMMLLGLFLFYVYRQTRSLGQVLLYLLLAIAGSLAFSFPVFLYRNSGSEAAHQ